MTTPSQFPADQIARTNLAWSRTGLAIAGNGALLAHAGLSRESVAILTIGCVVGAVGLLLWLASVLPNPEQRHHSFAVGRRTALVGVTVTTALVSTAALVTALTA